MKTFRVAMVAAFPYPTGQGTQALVGELARGLQSRGHSVHLICYHHQAYKRDEPFAIHRIPAVWGYRRIRSGPDGLKPFLDLLLLFRTIEVIKHERCQIIHAHNYEGAVVAAIASRVCKLPWTYHAHNLMGDELAYYFSSRPARFLAQLAGKVLDRFVPRQADRVIALHPQMGLALKRFGVRAERISIIEPGIDVGFWQNRSEQREPTPLAVYTGNLDRYQDLPILLQAMPRVVREVPKFRLILATPQEPGEANRLIQAHKVEEWTKVVHTQVAADTLKVLERAWIAVCPRSSWSGFPIKNINAAAAGVALVACQGSAYGLLPGRTGEVVRNHDVEGLAGAMIELCKDFPRSRALGEEGQQLARAKYSQERMVREVEKIWAACKPD